MKNENHLTEEEKNTKERNSAQVEGLKERLKQEKEGKKVLLKENQNLLKDNLSLKNQVQGLTECSVLKKLNGQIGIYPMVDLIRKLFGPLEIAQIRELLRPAPLPPGSRKILGKSKKNKK